MTNKQAGDFREFYKPYGLPPSLKNYGRASTPEEIAIVDGDLIFS